MFLFQGFLLFFFHFSGHLMASFAQLESTHHTIALFLCLALWFVFNLYTLKQYLGTVLLQEVLKFNSRSKYSYWKFYSIILFFQKNAVVTSFTRRKQCLHGVTKFISFTHDLLHLIPQSAEIEAKETGLQEKNSHNSFKVGPTKSNNTYDGLQKLATKTILFWSYLCYSYFLRHSLCE